MNRFFRTAYSTTFVYLGLTLFAVLITRVRMPFPAFSCLYFGLLLSLLPGATQRAAGKEWLFYALGALAAALGFVPLALWHCPPVHWLVHLLGMAAAAAFLSILRHRTTHTDFMAKYQFSAALLLIMIAFIYLAILTGIYQDGQALERTGAMRLAMNNIVPYAIVLLASGVLLLRGLRAQVGLADEQAFNRRQLRDTLIFAIVVTIVFAVDPFVYLQKGVVFLFNEVLRPAAGFIARMLGMLIKLLPRYQQPEEDSVIPPEESTDPKPMPVVDPTETEPEKYYVDENDLTLTTAYIFIGVAAVVLLIILAVQIRKLVLKLRGRDLDRGCGYPEETREELPPSEEKPRERKASRRNEAPRERIRALYGEFLQYLTKRRVRLGRADTCGEIQRQAEVHSVADASSLSALTVLYEQARYRMDEAPAEADARSMKDLLDSIKKRP